MQRRLDQSVHFVEGVPRSLPGEQPCGDGRGTAAYAPVRRQNLPAGRRSRLGKIANISPDGTLVGGIVGYATSKEARLWDVRKQRPLPSLVNAAHDLRFHPGSKLVVTAEERLARFWERRPPHGRCSPALDHPATIHQLLGFDRPGRQLATLLPGRVGAALGRAGAAVGTRRPAAAMDRGADRQATRRHGNCLGRIGATDREQLRHRDLEKMGGSTTAVDATAQPTLSIQVGDDRTIGRSSASPRPAAAAASRTACLRLLGGQDRESDRCARASPTPGSAREHPPKTRREVGLHPGLPL